MVQTNKYDVYLSFRGEDTRMNFASHLEAALSRNGVVVWRDEDCLLPGPEPINSQIRKAIESSRISIVILSRNYASSKWCLDELQQILDCRQVTGQIVFPVFYDVDPSDVRHQTGRFGDAFAEHEQRFKDNIHKVRAWRDALRQLADLSGYALLEDRYESQSVARIVEFILNTLQPVAPDVEQQRFPLGSMATAQPTDHDVYLSFRGEDTRMIFVSHLEAALSRNGVVVWRDEDCLRPGAEPINSQIRKAIESSRISIVILSRNYASSTWCLDELQQILDCRQVTGQKVLPVFYDVDPSDVRHQTGGFGDAFAKHEQRFKDNIEKVHAWRDALRQVADLSGFVLREDRDCNLEEVTILESLGSLSSIVSLNLSKNSFVSLPKSIIELSKLQILNLGGCKSLKKLPDLSTELNFSVEGKGSYSQERLSSCFSFINCFEVVDDQGCNNVAFAALRRFLEGIPYEGNKFEAIYPGSEISEWFSYRSERPVVSMELPQRWYKNKWMGYVLCAVFTLRQRLPPNLLGKWNYGTHSTAHGLHCEVKPGNLGVGGWCPSFACSEELGQIEKEHLWLSFVSGEYFGTTWQDSCHHLEFTFKTLGPGLERKQAKQATPVSTMQSQRTSVYPRKLETGYEMRFSEGTHVRLQIEKMMQSIEASEYQDEVKDDSISKGLDLSAILKHRIHDLPRPNE
ncbi:hypothetical protein DVH24_009510 [Malus domestica]|uniref:TIR domain-containing protein n=1 Tax=Malus domestica TaxID=3750 RepID=A0A498IR47_MALDO|nr:hypothetical protein DVH24_009510 [Malus domestica]